MPFPFTAALSGSPISTGPAVSGSGPVTQDSAFGPVNIGGFKSSGSATGSVSPIVIAGLAAATLLLVFMLKK